MKKFCAIILVAVAAAVLVFSACSSDPEKATQKDMLKYGEFFYDYDGDGEHVCKLTMNKDNTYSLIEYRESGGVYKSSSFTGTWSHVYTYEYEYCASSGVELINVTKKAVLGIYLLDGCTTAEDEELMGKRYFGYEKSKGEGVLFRTKETVNEEFLWNNREPAYGGIGSTKRQRVDLHGLTYKAIKD